MLLNENQTLNETILGLKGQVSHLNLELQHLEMTTTQLKAINNELRKDNEYLAKKITLKQGNDWGREVIIKQEEHLKEMEDSFRAEKLLLQTFNDELISKIRALESEQEETKYNEIQMTVLQKKLIEIENVINANTQTQPNTQILVYFFLLAIENERLHQIIHDFSGRLTVLENSDSEEEQWKTKCFFLEEKLKEIERTYII